MTRFVGLLLLASVAACSSSTGPQLSFEGKSTISPTPPTDVQTVVTVRNIGDNTTRINTNICGQPIRAFTTPGRDPAAMICAAIATVATLAPGDYYDFRLTGTIPTSLPSGVYYLAVNINGKLVPAGQFSK
jgi:hypothetical protein